MDLNPEIVSLLTDFRYWIMLPLVILEGPITIVTAGFLASAGDMKLHWVITLGIVGDLIGDYMYYYLGKFGGRKIAQKWGKFVGITEKRLLKLENLFHKHKIKTLVVSKLSNTLGTPVLFSAGLFNMSFKDFTIFNATATVLKTIVLAYVGYWYGHAYVNTFKYLNLGYKGFLILIALAFIIFFALKFITKKIRNTEKFN